MQEYNPVECSDCLRKCRSPACFARHKEGKRNFVTGRSVNLCELVKKCARCGLCYNTGPNTRVGNGHRCAKPKCRICGETLTRELETDHRCYIRPLPVSADHPDLIFYDFETFATENSVHVPFLVYAKTLKGEEKWFYSHGCVKHFLMYFRNERYRRNVFITHNAKGFDSYLVLKGMLKEGLSPRHILMTGSKILSFEDPHYGLKFIDSLSFLPMRLSDFPKALGFTDQTKGYFPHKFSSAERLEYVGPYPPASDYGVERMSEWERQDFHEWYDMAARGVFNFRKEALHYCKNDVVILSQGCMKFRDQFLGEMGVDPFDSITIASACMKVFITNYMTPKTLAIPCPYGYTRACKRFSHASIQWLEWIMAKEKIFIQHAINRGEKQISPFFVDGYAEIDGEKYAWEYHGCFYHGCPTCFDPAETCPLRGVRFSELWLNSEERVRTLESEHGVRVMVVREHEWLEMKKSCDRVKEFLRTFNPPEPLVPRAALYRGRTSALKLRHTAGPGEKVLYVDVTSLYPYVNSACSYALDHPTIIYKDFGDPRNYFGLIRATVYPPRGLFFPVLPYKSKSSKLLFPLCRTCAE
ncbi:uncharacterized protein LOC117597613 isoform X1 [Pangasianodon hypophthalmus]|uniref:uncharacterized protein LOC117597613 isoform X1 n=1 Tax=Pangasianodon hypophthalmus TaxID=310915 RepID=UPI0023080405|nr:uncharacterized protein LOC117597613 isoform X1 [Pangasianodon hypophthalmus]